VTDALSLAGLQNELIERGVSEAAAHKWLRERTPEYIAQLLDYHAWCKEHRPKFILDHGAWLTASLKNPIDFPERYLRFKEEAPRHAAEQRRRTEQERMALLNEARRHVGAPEERAKCALRGWIQGYQAAHRGQVPTEEHQQRWYEGRLRNIKLEDEEFFAEHAEHPELRDIAAQSLASEHKGTPDESLVSPSA
jgi:hypothetical protein